MSKRELIDEILKHNRSAAPEFLARFKERDLEAYLSRVSIVTPVVRDFTRLAPVRPSVPALRPMKRDLVPAGA